MAYRERRRRVLTCTSTSTSVGVTENGKKYKSGVLEGWQIVVASPMQLAFLTKLEKSLNPKKKNNGSKHHEASYHSRSRFPRQGHKLPKSSKLHKGSSPKKFFLSSDESQEVCCPSEETPNKKAIKHLHNKTKSKSKYFVQSITAWE